MDPTDTAAPVKNDVSKKLFNATLFVIDKKKKKFNLTVHQEKTD